MPQWGPIAVSPTQHNAPGARTCALRVQSSALTRPRGTSRTPRRPVLTGLIQPVVDASSGTEVMNPKLVSWTFISKFEASINGQFYPLHHQHWPSHASQ